MQDVLPIEGDIQCMLDLEDNNALTCTFNTWEFRKNLFQMHSDKSPGPYGLNPTFYKRFWDLYGDNIFHARITWLEQGEFPPQLNNINIILIPKNDNSTSMKDLRPISLCNVLYKIVSKVLANRLKIVLHKCIS